MACMVTNASANTIHYLPGLCWGWVEIRIASKGKRVDRSLIESLDACLLEDLNVSTSVVWLSCCIFVRNYSFLDSWIDQTNFGQMIKPLHCTIGGGMTPPPVCKLWYQQQRRVLRRQQQIRGAAGSSYSPLSCCCEFNFSQAERIRVQSWKVYLEI